MAWCVEFQRAIAIANVSLGSRRFIGWIRMTTPRPGKLREASATDRQARLAEVRREIAAGTYETHERLEAAVDALLDELVGEPPRPTPRPK
jgi:hypothetical protein